MLFIVLLVLSLGGRAEELKVEELKAEELKAQDTKVEETKVEETKVEESANESVQTEAIKADPKADPVKADPIETENTSENISEKSSFGQFNVSLSNYLYNSTLLYNGQVFYKSTGSRVLTTFGGQFQLEMCPWLYGFQVPIFSENQVTTYGPGSFYEGARRETSQQGISNILVEMGREVDWGQVYFQYYTAKKNFQENADSANEKVQSRGYFQIKGVGEFEADEKPLLAEFQLAYHLPERTLDSEGTEISTRSHAYQLGGKAGTRWEWQGSSDTSQAYLGYLWTSERQASHSGVVPKDYAPTTHQALFRFEYSHPYEENIVLTFSYELNHFFKRDFQTGSLSLAVAPSQSHLLEIKTSYSW